MTGGTLFACVERSLWTDERIDDMVHRIEKRFDDVDKHFDAIDRRFDRLEVELSAIRREMHTQFLVVTTALIGLAGAMVVHSLWG